MSTTADPVVLLERALDQTERVLTTVDASRFADPTPCGEWDLRALVNHVAGSPARFAVMVRGGTVDRAQPAPDHTAGDYLAVWRAGRDELVAAWHEPDAMDRTLHFPFADLPARAGIGIQIVENAVHAWDIADTLGETSTLDESLAEAALIWAQKLMDPARRAPGGPFAPEVEAPANADAVARLAAFLGRRPLGVGTVIP